MNERDVNNLQFLLCCDREVLNSWYNDASPDELEYALNLINTFYKKVLHDYEHPDAPVEDLTQAEQVLAKFML